MANNAARAVGDGFDGILTILEAPLGDASTAHLELDRMQLELSRKLRELMEQERLKRAGLKTERELLLLEGSAREDALKARVRTLEQHVSQASESVQVCRDQLQRLSREASAARRRNHTYRQQRAEEVRRYLGELRRVRQDAEDLRRLLVVARGDLQGINAQAASLEVALTNEKLARSQDMSEVVRVLQTGTTELETKVEELDAGYATKYCMLQSKLDLLADKMEALRGHVRNLRMDKAQSNISAALQEELIGRLQQQNEELLHNALCMSDRVGTLESENVTLVEEACRAQHLEAEVQRLGEAVMQQAVAEKPKDRSPPITIPEVISAVEGMTAACYSRVTGGHALHGLASSMGLLGCDAAIVLLNMLRQYRGNERVIVAILDALVRVVVEGPVSQITFTLPLLVAAGGREALLDVMGRPLPLAAMESAVVLISALAAAPNAHVEGPDDHAALDAVTNVLKMVGGNERFDFVLLMAIYNLCVSSSWAQVRSMWCALVYVPELI